MYCTTDTRAAVRVPPRETWVGANRVIKTRAGVVDAVARRGIGKPTFSRKLLSWEWHVAGRCERPVFLTLQGRREHASDPFFTATTIREPWRQGVTLGDTTTGGLPVHGDLHVRCRRCQRCLNYRRAQWTNRTLERLAEIDAPTARVWFATFTFDPARYNLLKLRAEREAGEKWGTRLPDGVLSPAQFKMSAAQGYKFVQLWLKSVRKGGSYRHEREGNKFQSPSRVRYVCTAEAGDQTGRLHFHMLLMEYGPSAGPWVQLRKRFLQQKWRYGHSDFKLVKDRNDRRLANYVCKYLAKSLSARVYASQKLSQTLKTAEAIVPAAYGSALSLRSGSPDPARGTRAEDAPSEAEERNSCVTRKDKRPLNEEEGNGSLLILDQSKEDQLDGWIIPFFETG